MCHISSEECLSCSTHTWNQIFTLFFSCEIISSFLIRTWFPSEFIYFRYLIRNRYLLISYHVVNRFRRFQVLFSTNSFLHILIVFPELIKRDTGRSFPYFHSVLTFYFSAFPVIYDASTKNKNLSFMLRNLSNFFFFFYFVNENVVFFN